MRPAVFYSRLFSYYGAKKEIMFQKYRMTLMFMLHHLLHVSRAYKIFNLIYWKLFQRQYQKIKIPQSLTPKAVTNAGIILTKEYGRTRKPGEPCGRVIDNTNILDRMIDFFKPVGSPQRVQYYMNQINNFLNNNNPQQIPVLGKGDYALWCTRCMHHDYLPVYYTLKWINKDGIPTGCGICIYHTQPKGSLYYTGNWGICGPYINIEELSIDLVKAFSGTDIIAWSMYSGDLKLLNYGKGIPVVDDLPIQP